ncbi:PEP-CTERM sorting domain-containing protein [Methylomonas paludis]|uniref:PEP-CTERM sorting domain-containing protein n=1 Tax=Methylomonas paludis TaxID=1173101 RepID=A0A975ML97_9GAMM|nr:PEP-CTERM sorting domain-containing protein [Methylomonas paludis]QWF69674.1 PEP-CTERM sorting domain-containing protein [Methylomonas paludis]
MRTSLTLGLLSAALMLSNTVAQADTVFSTANYNAAEPGDFSIDSANFLATSFTLTQAEQITAIDGHFSQYGDGNTIFAAISSAANLANWSSSVVGQTSFAPNTDGTDSSAALSLTLDPGTYYLVLGSGLSGTTGATGLATGQDVIGSPQFYQSFDGGASWGNLGQNDLRLALEGTAVSSVPVPGTLPLLVSGLGVLAAGMRKRKA